MTVDIDRRTFIKAGGAFALANYPPIAIAASAASEIGGVVHHTFVVADERLPASRLYAARAQAKGWQPLIFSDDAGELWFDFPKQPVSLTGLTRRSDFFLLSQFARHRNLTVRHAQTLGNGIRHQCVSWLIA